MMQRTNKSEVIFGEDRGTIQVRRLELTKLQEEVEELTQLVAYWKSKAGRLSDELADTRLIQEEQTNRIAFLEKKQCKCDNKLQQLRQEQLRQEKNVKELYTAMSDKLKMDQTLQVVELSKCISNTKSVHVANGIFPDKEVPEQEGATTPLTGFDQGHVATPPAMEKGRRGKRSRKRAGKREREAAKCSDTAVPGSKFLLFAERHRTAISQKSQILRQSTTHGADGPFSILVDHSRLLDFDVKLRFFRTELERAGAGIRRKDLVVHVKRAHVFEDSFQKLNERSQEEWKNRFSIFFEGEEGQDAGVLLREWYRIISREMFNPIYALFTPSSASRVTYIINSGSHRNSDHLGYFKFVGRVIAKAIYDNQPLECYFTRWFYRHILGKHVNYTDMESEDYEGLAYLMKHNVSELGLNDLNFSLKGRDLKPNGSKIPVTEKNKKEYIRLVCQMKTTGAIRKQLDAFLEGFYNIIPKRLISVFNEQELELLISGLPNSDMEELETNSE